jgi:hypothetical protein
MSTITRTQLRFAMLGFALGITCMIALFVAGALSGTAPMMVIASTTAAALASSAAGLYATLSKKVQR